MNKPKVLYLHGFEENPDSVKPACLRDSMKYDFTYTDLGMYLTKRHSPILYGLFSSLGLGCIAAAVLGGFLTKRVSVGLLVYVISLCVFRHSLLARGISGSYKATLKIAKEAFDRTKPDIVVGFSWGGSLAVELIHEHPGTRAVLLAPAYHKMHEMMQAPTLPHISSPAPVALLHSRDDSIVPFPHTEALARSLSNPIVKTVDGEGHKLWGTADNGVLVGLIDEVLAVK